MKKNWGVVAPLCPNQGPYLIEKHTIILKNLINIWLLSCECKL